MKRSSKGLVNVDVIKGALLGMKLEAQEILRHHQAWLSSGGSHEPPYFWQWMKASVPVLESTIHLVGDLSWVDEAQSVEGLWRTLLRAEARHSRCRRIYSVVVEEDRRAGEYLRAYSERLMDRAAFQARQVNRRRRRGTSNYRQFLNDEELAALNKAD